MFRRASVVLASTIMLLGSSAPVALARDGIPSGAQRQTNDLAAVGAYFGTISSGWRTGDFSRLVGVLAPRASLVRTDMRGRTKVYANLSAIVSYFRDAREQGALPEVGITGISRLSASVVIAYTEAGGSGSTIVSRSVQVFIVKDGKIVGCDWVVLSGAQQG
jgi:hypothetical protein